MNYPMKLAPVFKDYLWGGTKLREHYNKKCDMPVIAESWEVSTHPDGLSVIAGGELKGQTLKSAAGELPVLVKLIDAREPLSLQVHPGDEYAMQHHGHVPASQVRGKNEMWHILEAGPGAELILGFNKNADKNELRQMIKDGSIMQAVRRVPVKAGDFYCVPAGLVHAIGGGIVLLEAQQNSNITYRVYDYGRTGPDGKERELHIDKALDVIDTGITAIKTHTGTPAQWEYFQSRLIAAGKETELCCGQAAFYSLTVTGGEIMLKHKSGNMKLRKGESVFLPAGAGSCVIHSADGGEASVITVAK